MTSALGGMSINSESRRIYMCVKKYIGGLIILKKRKASCPIRFTVVLMLIFMLSQCLVLTALAAHENETTTGGQVNKGPSILEAVKSINGPQLVFNAVPLMMGTMGTIWTMGTSSYFQGIVDQVQEWFGSNGVKNTDVTISAPSAPQGPILVDKETTADGSKIMLTFNKAMAELPAAPAGFAVTVDGADSVIQAVGLNTNPAIIEITINEVVNCNDDLEISYIAGTVLAQDGGVLASFSKQIVSNKSTLKPPPPKQNMFYNNLNQLIEMRLPSGEVVKYTYDKKGNCIKIEVIDKQSEGEKS